MAVQLGSGQWTFEVNENWAKVPEEITLGDCAAVGVDRHNRVYAFNRGEHPVGCSMPRAICCAPGARAFRRAPRRSYGAGRHDLSDR